MTENAVIVGAGVVGLVTAYRLARDGLAVTVVNAAHSRGGASVNNAGWIVRIMSPPVPAPETGTGAAVDGAKVDQSGEHDWRGELAKNGPKYLR